MWFKCKTEAFAVARTATVNSLDFTELQNVALLFHYTSYFVFINLAQQLNMMMRNQTASPGLGFNESHWALYTWTKSWCLLMSWSREPCIERWHSFSLRFSSCMESRLYTSLAIGRLLLKELQRTDFLIDYSSVMSLAFLCSEAVCLYVCEGP